MSDTKGSISERAALAYHADGRKGKIEVVPTKPTATQVDLSLAYSPGVAHPCLAIADDPLLAYDYTARGNLVAVISNGTAVLGLGNIGALAGKPVMEGKAVLFKRFADIDVFDLELDTEDVDAFCAAVELLEPTFGGINLEDIKAPECFEIEERLKRTMGIPVFHDDQHGTAIISAAALINACEVTGREVASVRVVISGAGAAAVSCAELYKQIGVAAENIIMCDSRGVIYRGREHGMNAIKERYAVDTDARTLADALVGADLMLGLSKGGVVSQDMVRSMADRPLLFALANPDPEIAYEDAKAAREDAVVATGRTDFPNQVNNVLGFPFIFRGALDIRATGINEEMKLAAVHALAQLAREDVPDSVLKAYGLEHLAFGPEYLIPKPFDHRVLLRVAPAVARAGMESGVARQSIDDWGAYKNRLAASISRRLSLMRTLIDRARSEPKRVVFPEGDHHKILRAVRRVVDKGIAHPVLLADPAVVEPRLRELGVDLDAVTIIHPHSHDNERYVHDLFERRQRDGVTLDIARRLMRTSRNAFGAMMVASGDADALLGGVTTNYSDTIRPALQIIGTRDDVHRVVGVYLLLIGERILFLADTTVNIEPDAETLASTAFVTAELARRFDVEPRVAMLSFSNFGSNDHPAARKVRRAVEIARERAPDFELDGEMQADTAVLASVLNDTYPWCSLTGPANVLVFPELQSANTAYKLLWRLAKAEAVGPILLGMDRPVHVLEQGSEVADIVNMTAMCVVDAQELKG